MYTVNRGMMGLGFSLPGLLTGGAADLVGAVSGGGGKGGGGGGGTPTKAQIAAGVTKAQIAANTKVQLAALHAAEVAAEAKAATAIAASNAQAAQYAAETAPDAVQSSFSFESLLDFRKADGSVDVLKVAMVGGAALLAFRLMRRR